MSLPPRARARPIPNKLTDEVVAKICARIAKGENRVSACAAEGVSDSALRKLRAEHEDLNERLEIAEGEGAAWYAAKVATAEAGKDARDDWKRWAWLGERIHPRVFAPAPKKLEHTGKDGGPLQTMSASTEEIIGELGALGYDVTRRGDE